MNWDKDDIIEYLTDEYCRHWNKRQDYLVNDNQVESEYELIICEYIFNLLKTITGGSPNDVADHLNDKLEGIFEFDPRIPYGIREGKKVCLCSDVLYCDYPSFVSMFGEDTAQELLDDLFILENDEVYIPRGTYMTYKGCDPTASGWPTFEIYGEEFDFAGDPFKVKYVKD